MAGAAADKEINMVVVHVVLCSWCGSSDKVHMDVVYLVWFIWMWCIWYGSSQCCAFGEFIVIYMGVVYLGVVYQVWFIWEGSSGCCASGVMYLVRCICGAVHYV